MRVKFLLLLSALFMSVGVIAQQKVVSGTVSDNTGPLPGVSILIKGTNSGTETDFDGKYSLRANQGDVLVFTYLGMKTVERTVGAASTIDVILEEDSDVLDEIVVVAYGTQSKESFTGSAAVIGAEDLAQRAATSPIAAIEGKTTGVQFVSASGQPGSSPGIVIRGVGTLNGSTEPLYIVDGVQFQGGLNSINQDDIESMTILKDAASTSLYGSRAANGVVIITTKKGKKGSMRTNVSTQYGIISKGIPEYDYADAGMYYELMWEAYKNTSALQSLPDPAAEASSSIYFRLGYNPFNVANDQIVGTDGKLNPNAQVIYQGLDWYNELERTGSRTNHSLNISSGSDKGSIFFSASYLEEEGYVIESNYDRITTRLNGDFDANDWLKIGGSLNLTLSDSHGPPSRGGSIANPFGFAKNIGSIYPVYVVDNNGMIVTGADGNRLYDYGEGYPDYNILSRPYSPGRHALAEAILNEEVTKINNLGFRYYADFKLMEGLNFRVNYGQDLQDFINKSYENEEVGDGAPTGRYSETRYRRTVENFNQILTYSKTFNDVNKVDVTLGHESYDRHYSELNGIANTQTVDDIYEFDNFSAGDNLGGYSSDKTLEGYFARVNYSYDNKYFLSGSFRRDGTSVFGPDVRWGNFFSVGGSWRMDQEDFIKNIKFIDRMKLRASYGEVGNDNLGNFYIYQGLYSILPNGGDPGFYWNTTGNANLTWETVESFDVALEFGLFDGLFDGSFEYYRKTSSDLLYNVPIPLSEGLNVAPDNVGTMYNEGLEISLNTHIINKDDFDWNLTLQASTLNNKITDLPSPFVTGSKRWAEGKSRFDFFIYDYAGVDPATGDALYYMYEEDEDLGSVPVLDANGNHETTNDYQDANKTYVGESSIPDLIGSVANSFRYKNVSLDFLFVYGIGGKILDYGYSDMMHPGTYGSSLHPDMANAWRAPGDITNVPRLENGNPNQTVGMSTRFLTDASYLALRNVNLSYDLDKTLTDKLGISSLRLFASGENLFLSSKRRGLNPQYNLSGTPSGNDYNPSRVVSFGVNVSF